MVRFFGLQLLSSALTVPKHGRRRPEARDFVGVSNVTVLHDGKFVERCVCYLFVALATIVLRDGHGARIKESVCKGATTSMGS